MNNSVTEVGSKNFALNRAEIDKTNTGFDVVIKRNNFIAQLEKIAFVIHFKFESVYGVALIAPAGEITAVNVAEGEYFQRFSHYEKRMRRAAR